jgi:hypothetical protein
LDFSLEAFDYLFDGYSTRALSNIEDKIDRLAGRLEYGQCRLAGAARGDVIEFITGIGVTARADALSYLNRCLEGSRQLTICDPFFLCSIRATSPDDYVAAIESVLPQTLKSLDIFSGRRRRDALVAKGLNQMFKRKGIRVNCYKTDDIHDRVWIKNYSEAYSVGTSFNGLGNKCAFILPLPSDDLRGFLTEISIRRAELPMSKSV